MFPIEDSGLRQVTDTNKSLKMIFYAVLYAKGMLGLLIMKINTGNMKNTQWVTHINC